MKAPPEPTEGVIAWNVCTSCNYRCSYCSQRMKDDRGRWSRDTPAFLRAFARLPGSWEVKLSGGEPFVHPRFMEIVAGLAAAGLRVSVVTNLAASDAELDSFVDATGGRLGVLSASLHLEYVADVGAFARRAGRLAARLADTSASLCVTTVATAAAMPRLPDIAKLFADEGITLKIQPERDEGRIVDYEPADVALIEELGGHNGLGAMAYDFFGRSCWAGARFIVMDDRGEVYRCYPARRSVQRALGLRAGKIPSPERERALGKLGNFLDPGFQLRPGPEACLYRHCYCSVPIARGMMAREALGGAA